MHDAKPETYLRTSRTLELRKLSVTTIIYLHLGDSHRPHALSKTQNTASVSLKKYKSVSKAYMRQLPKRTAVSYD